MTEKQPETKPREVIGITNGRLIFADDGLEAAKRAENRERVISEVDKSYPPVYPVKKKKPTS